MTEEHPQKTMAPATMAMQSQSRQNPDHPGIWGSIRVPVYIGMVIVVSFFVLFGGWATLAPLDSAAMATGVVSVEGKRKTVQHLEGGIIGEINIKAGDKIRAGQILIRLDDTQPKANLELLQGRLNSIIALEARLRAESDMRQEIEFPESIYNKRDQAKISEIISGQINIFESRRKTVVGKTEILNLQNAQLSEEIIGLQGQIKAEDTQIKLISLEVKDVQGLFDKGLVPRPRLLALQRRLAEIEGSKSQHQADIARARQGIAETRLKMSELRTEMVNESVQQLRETQNEHRDLIEQARAAKDVLRRIDIRAPIDGAVVNLRVHTAGGVIAPGEQLLDIVSLDDRLIIEARVDPQDIDVVSEGLSALVRLTAFSQRRSSPIEGRVITVSADALTDERSGQTYYLARIELMEDPKEVLDGVVIQPGMQAEVMIVTGARTLFEYLLQPVGDVLNRSLREQ